MGGIREEGNEDGALLEADQRQRRPPQGSGPAKNDGYGTEEGELGDGDPGGDEGESSGWEN